jgi:hypothetical protein
MPVCLRGFVVLAEGLARDKIVMRKVLWLSCLRAKMTGRVMVHDVDEGKVHRVPPEVPMVGVAWCTGR